MIIKYGVFCSYNPAKSSSNMRSIAFSWNRNVNINQIRVRKKGKKKIKYQTVQKILVVLQDADIRGVRIRKRAKCSAIK